MMPVKSCSQPPSGGCVLKLPYTDAAALKSMPAAFGRLCVETLDKVNKMADDGPAAFGRLCVETSLSRTTATETVPPAAFGRLCVETTRCSLCRRRLRPAAFGRLCVETPVSASPLDGVNPAAFGRLCVETTCLIFEASLSAPSRLRAAVC